MTIQTCVGRAHDELFVRGKNNRQNKFLTRTTTEILEGLTAEITCGEPTRNENVLGY